MDLNVSLELEQLVKSPSLVSFNEVVNAVFKAQRSCSDFEQNLSSAKSLSAHQKTEAQINCTFSCQQAAK